MVIMKNIYEKKIQEYNLYDTIFQTDDISDSETNIGIDQCDSSYDYLK